MKKIGILVVAMVLAGSSAWAFGRGCGMGPGFGMNPAVASGLNLTEDQKVQIESRREAFMEETAPLRSELLTKREELRQLWAAANPDQGRITAKQQEVQEVQSRIQEKAIQYRLDCRQVLTPEQQGQLTTLASSRGGRGAGRGCGMGGW